MYISLCVALLRITCMIAILYLLLIIRYKHFWYVVNMITLKSNFIYKMTYQGLTLFITLIFFNILVELILMLSFQVQRSSLIAFTYALNFVLVILLIAMFPFIGKIF
ncbi:hypothetical protein DICVIV_14292 [Dictyocaulus viviparus]|uniref:Uncharacterized protein n=1 Tax=Dictyocaulus viviparus TaxID=29172 RepID=A0A0D8X5K9_DICVI|nr:hypothetical protein DICVIV_14292 [Dictyocaulus viviparus]